MFKKNWGGKFLKEVYYAHQGCIYLIKYSKNANIVKYKNKIQMWFIPVHGKAAFSTVITPLFIVTILQKSF